MNAKIAEIIKQKRLECGMSQRQLAAAIGVSGSMIAQIERGSKTVSLGLAAEMAKVFDCALTDLVE